MTANGALVAAGPLDVAPRAGTREAPAVSALVVRPAFDALYDEHFEFVWRSLLRLGVDASNLDDAAQEVFLVVHRRLGDFEPRSSVKAWLFGIVVRVAHDHRRRAKRKGGLDELVDAIDPRGGPLEDVLTLDAARTLERLLQTLDPDQRSVFVMVELEQLTAPEIAEAFGIKLNTVYSRLRAARRAFEASLRDHKLEEAP